MRRTKNSWPTWRPPASPALMVMRSPGAALSRVSSVWLPVTRSGTAGTSFTADGAQAIASTSGGRCVAAQAGPVCAETAGGAASGASAAKSAAVRVNLMAPSTGAARSPGLLRVQQFQTLPRVLGELALCKFGEQAFEVRDRLRLPVLLIGRTVGPEQRFREVEVDAVAPREFRVLFEHFAETVHGAGIPARAEVVHAHPVRRHAQAVARLAPPRPDLGHQRAVRVAVEEDLILLEALARLGLIALGCAHLLLMAHRQAELRHVGLRVGGVEGEELAELVGAHHQRLGGPLAEVGFAHSELCVGPERALRVVVHHLTVVL